MMHVWSIFGQVFISKLNILKLEHSLDKKWIKRKLEKVEGVLQQPNW